MGTRSATERRMLLEFARARLAWLEAVLVLRLCAEVEGVMDELSRVVASSCSSDGRDRGCEGRLLEAEEGSRL